MKVSILVALFVSLVTLSACSADDSSFENFKKRFNKEYQSQEEEKRAKENVLKHQKEIDEHNKLYDQGKYSYALDLFEHSDLSDEEFKDFLGGNTFEDEEDEHPRSKRAYKSYFNEHFPTGPASINWTEKGIVSPVGSQKHCGSCWAFSATGVVETFLLKRGINAQVSPQQLLDCETYKAKGCKGGHPRLGLEYIRDNGIAKLSDYPYVQEAGDCKFTKEKNFTSINQVVNIRTKGNETFMRDVVALAGPISVNICLTEKFRHSIREGVFHVDECCGKNKIGGHAPMITGYGNDPKHGPYWMIKNSWGTTWGNNGFIKFRRGENMCNIARHALYAE